MINKNMDASGNWQTSTPLQCRHDSGYGNYPKHYGLLELSPIRKQSSDVQEMNYLGNPDKINPKKLNFLNLVNAQIGNNSINDSGIASGTDESVSENNITVKKASQYVVDENCNFISLLNCDTGKEIYQPSKYICKDHSHEKDGKCKTYVNASKKIYTSYAISSEIFKSVNKNPKIDFLYELDIRNCSGIISDILSHLPDNDLRQANNVSKRWQDIVSSDRSANSRRTSYINNKKNAARGPNKENKIQIAALVERDHKTAFTSLANLENDTKQPLIFETFQGRFDSFVQELKIDENQHSLMKCPKCRYPAKVDAKLKYCCTRNLCKHEFCRKCLGPFLDNHKCSEPDLNNSGSSILVGSKKSRKNLRRLKA